MFLSLLLTTLSVLTALITPSHVSLTSQNKQRRHYFIFSLIPDSVTANNSQKILILAPLKQLMLCFLICLEIVASKINIWHEIIPCLLISFLSIRCYQLVLPIYASKKFLFIFKPNVLERYRDTRGKIKTSFSFYCLLLPSAISMYNL